MIQTHTTCMSMVGANACVHLLFRPFFVIFANGSKSEKPCHWFRIDEEKTNQKIRLKRKTIKTETTKYYFEHCQSSTAFACSHTRKALEPQRIEERKKAIDFEFHVSCIKNLVSKDRAGKRNKFFM